MSWQEIVPEGDVEELRRRLLGAFTRAWAANVERHQPDELGDTALNFGLNVTTNARHLAAVAVSNVPGIEDHERGQLRWFEIDDDGRRHRIYVYKAPPGAVSVEDVSFGDSQIKKELTTANAAQMALPLDGQVKVDIENVVIVMFGDSVVGFERAVIGAPYVHRFQKEKSTKIVEDVRWAWLEPFGDADYGGDVQRAPIQKTPPDDDLPVRLRPVVDVDSEATG
jgi:hypothetical protein